MVTLYSLPSYAQKQWVLDKTHSNVNFSVSHMVVSEVDGRFDNFEATLLQPNEDLTGAKITATIDPSSINTANERRDGHLKSDDFFNSDQFPKATFVSKNVKKGEGNKFKITGDLTIRDITKEVTFDAVFMGVLGKKMGLKATTTINRFDYNLKWNRLMEAGGAVVGEDVTLTIKAEWDLK